VKRFDYPVLITLFLDFVIPVHCSLISVRNRCTADCKYAVLACDPVRSVYSFMNLYPLKTLRGVSDVFFICDLPRCELTGTEMSNIIFHSVTVLCLLVNRITHLGKL
jgi:hypothetical protein